jgi:preprotein translocase subunit YajC
MKIHDYILMVLLIAGMIIFIIFYIKHDMKKIKVFFQHINDFRKNVHINQECVYHNMGSNNIRGKITNITDDEVIIEIKVSKKNIYPDENEILKRL